MRALILLVCMSLLVIPALAGMYAASDDQIQSVAQKAKVKRYGVTGSLRMFDKRKRTATLTQVRIKGAPSGKGRPGKFVLGVKGAKVIVTYNGKVISRRLSGLRRGRSVSVIARMTGRSRPGALPALRALTIKQKLQGEKVEPPPVIDPVNPADPLDPSESIDPVDPVDPVGTFSRVQVVEREFTLTLSRPSVAAGEVTVEMVNMGEDPHNVYLQRIGSSDPVLWVGYEEHVQEAEHAPGSVISSTFTLAPGVYKVWCEVNGHETLGMVARLTVE